MKVINNNSVFERSKDFHQVGTFPSSCKDLESHRTKHSSTNPHKHATVSENDRYVSVDKLFAILVDKSADVTNVWKSKIDFIGLCDEFSTQY